MDATFNCAVLDGDTLVVRDNGEGRVEFIVTDSAWNSLTHRAVVELSRESVRDLVGMLQVWLAEDAAYGETVGRE